MEKGKLSFLDLRQQVALAYGEGRYDAALEVVERHADEFLEKAANITLWRICLLSLCARPDESLSALREALDRGLWWHESEFRDSDLDAVRDLPEFKRLVGISQEKCEQASADRKPERLLLVPDKTVDLYPLLIYFHGRNGNMRSDLEQWEAARRGGWLVLLPQSAQAVFPGGYCWDDPAQGIADVKFHYEQILREHAIDRGRVVLAGFSQGGGMALYAALSGEIPVRGYIGVGAWWHSVEELAELAARGNKPGAYFVTGGQDQSLARIREIQAMLRLNDIPLDEEFHSDIGHVYPPDFASSFEKAIEFIC